MKMSIAKKKVIALVSVIVAMILLLVLTASGLIPGLSALAATPQSASGIGYYVRAVLPENQIDDTLTYFDLRMQPGQTQQLEVEVVNETDEAIVVDLAAISASTNRNGVIDYKTPGIRDKTLAIPFSGIAHWENGSLTVAPNATATARITVAMPAEQYDGVVLGGLVFTRQHTGGQAEAGMSLQNVYSYVIGVKLSETDTVVPPRFELESVKAETVNYLPAMVHYVRNTEAAIAKGIALNVVVKDSAGNVVAQASRQGIDMAPNSVMPLAVTPLAGDPASGGGSGEAATDGQLSPGDYTSTITLEQDGDAQTMEQRFTIGSVEAAAINTAMPGSGNQPAEDGNLLVILLLIVGGVIILALVVIIILLALRRKKAAKPAAPTARPQPPQRNIYHRHSR